MILFRAYVRCLDHRPPFVDLRFLKTGEGLLVRVSELLAGPAVRDGLPVPVSVQYHAVDKVAMSVVYPQGRHHMAKIRVFVDFLVERLARAPWRSGPATRSRRALDRSG